MVVINNCNGFTVFIIPITIVYYNQFALSVDGEAQNEEFRRVLTEIIQPYKSEELSEEDAKYIEKTLWAVYYFDRLTKQFIHCDDAHDYLSQSIHFRTNK